MLVVRDCQCLGLARSWRDRRGSPHGWLVLLGSAFPLGFFFFFFFNIGFCSGGILVGSGQWWCGGHGGGAVVVTGQCRCGARG